jgi:hypothetical protein
MKSISDALWQRNIGIDSWILLTYPIGWLTWGENHPCCHYCRMYVWSWMAFSDKMIQALKCPAQNPLLIEKIPVKTMIIHSRSICGWDTSCLFDRESLKKNPHGSLNSIDSFWFWYAFHQRTHDSPLFSTFRQSIDHFSAYSKGREAVFLSPVSLFEESERFRDWSKSFIELLMIMLILSDTGFSDRPAFCSLT